MRIKSSTAIINLLERHMVGVFSFTNICTGVYIKNAEYELIDVTLTNNFPIGVSNEFIKNQSIEVSVKDGALVVITSKNF